MSRYYLGAVVLVLGGCTPPGKPAPVPNGGLPTKPTDFAGLYEKNCAGCHGANGTLGPAPPLNDPLFLQIVPDAELTHVIAVGRPGTPMPAFGRAEGGHLEPDQVEALARGLKREWAEPTRFKDVPPYPYSPGGDARKGEELFVRACAGCHGPGGNGGTFEHRAIGANNDPAFLSLSSDQVLRRSVITGRPDLGMPNFAERTGRPADFHPLSVRDVADLTALLISWRKPPEKK